MDQERIAGGKSVRKPATFNALTASDFGRQRTIKLMDAASTTPVLQPRRDGGVLMQRMVLPTCPEHFDTYRQAAAWMLRLGRALKRSNVPICQHISRRDNNANFEIAYQLIACGKRISERYGENTVEMKLRERLRAALSRPNGEFRRTDPPLKS